MTDADDAAHNWHGSILRLIVQRENAVYEMRLPDGTRAALRLHRTGYQEKAAIRSELWWCAALAQAGQPVPSPIPGVAGDMLVTLANGQCASVVSWIDGAPMGQAGIPLPEGPKDQADLHVRLGRLLARLHSETDRLTLPPDFTRPRWTGDGLVGDNPFWGKFWEHPALSPSERARLCAARAFLHQAIERHHDTGGDFGLIHADVLRENVFVNNRSLSLIDFDDSGFGYRLYDLGTVMSQNLAQPNRDNLRDALIKGYSTLRAVDPFMVDMFTLARCCASVGWTMPRLAPADPIHRSHIARALACAERVMGQTSTG